MDHHSFIKDTLGDVESAKYGGPDKSKVPRFRRTGGGRVFGLDDGLRIASGSKPGMVAITPRGIKRCRYTDVENQKRSQSASQKRIRARSPTETIATDQSYISFEKGKKKQSEKPVEFVYLGHEFAGTNRSSSQVLSDEEVGDQTSSSEEYSDADGESPYQEVQGRLKALDAKVRSDALDTESWLALVDIQAEVVDMSMQDKSRRTENGVGTSKHQSNMRQSIVNVQLTVLDRAIRAHPMNATCIPLLLAKLDLAAISGTWDSMRIQEEWTRVISSCSSHWDDSVKVWRRYIAWKLSDSDSFMFHDMLEIFATALKAFQLNYYDEDSQAGRARIESASLDILGMIINVMMDASYVERALGLLQALTELTFRRPSIHSISTQDAFQRSCNDLEDYWDLEETRIGEEGSDGWSAFLDTVRNKPQKLAPKQAKAAEEMASFTFSSMPSDFNDPDPVVRWLALENARSHLRKMPAKENEEADWSTGELEVDPFSVVLFSDIHSFLIPIESDEGKRSLLDLFFWALGVPQNVSKRGNRRASPLIVDQIWPSHLVNSQHQHQSWEVIGGEIMERPRASTLNDPFKMPIKTWPMRLDELFPVQADKAKAWFSTWACLVKDDSVGIKIAKAVMEQLSEQDVQISLSRLGLCASTQSHKATVKLAKQVLGQDRNNVDLWRAFARLERNAGEIKSARRVYKSVLTVSDPPHLQDLSPIWADWAELEWEAGEHKTAVSVLVSAIRSDMAQCEQQVLENVKTQSNSSLEILRTRRALEKLLLQGNYSNGSSDSSSSSSSSSVIFCAALFQYLSQGADEAFDSAMQTFHVATTVNAGQKDVLEEVGMTQCKFIWRHICGDVSTARSRLYIPRSITQLFTQYVLLFPHNSAFVALLAAFEMTTKVENVLRRVLEEKMQANKDTVEEQDWLIYLYCELHMSLHLVNENAVRRLFERAIQSRDTANSSMLWQLYLQFEVLLCRRAARAANKSQEGLNRDTRPSETQRNAAKTDQRQLQAATMRAKAILYRAIGKVPYCKGK